ncbi:AAA family ATPase [Fuerstiella marisgermanici]|uniref:Recombination protein F n=1 Tax=Fuerstiella marisgermanici TaxID=1891926 RepID=A0A1P8WBP7_9PLAN|nr:ATP-binding protein [Fuerstiella marisgermanici]APZ91490.1 recombination protein F [Fuerstiella marisgermanici]
MITQVRITNFKAIRSAAVDLTPIHLLIGPNDSGKTSVLEALAAICRSVDHSAPESFVGRWQGRELVNAAAEMQLVEIAITAVSQQGTFDYRLEAEFSGSGRDTRWSAAEINVDGENKSILSDNPQHTLPWYSRLSTQHAKRAEHRPEMSWATLLETAISGCWYLRWTARNLALPTALNPDRRFRLEGNGFGLPTLIDDLLNYDRDSFSALESEFIEIFPNVKSIALVQQQGFNSPVDQADDTLSLQPSPGKQVVFRLKNSNRDLPASQAAEGMLYILGYLALMYLPTPPRVLLIEEPENGIHPHRVGDIVRILRGLVARHPGTQIVLTSHSPYLVDAFQPNEVTWCHREPSGDVVLTRLDTLPEVERSLSIFSLGEIWTGELEPSSSVEATE